MRRLAALLSWEVFQWLGPLTYAIYVLHYRIVFEVVYGHLPRRVLDEVAWLGGGPGFAHLSVYAITTLVISVALSIPIVHVVEMNVVSRLGVLVRRIEGVQVK